MITSFLKRGQILLGLIAAAAMIAPALTLGAGYEFEGVGAAQVSRGGAAIADSDDWTATYWNPANIVRATEKGQHEIGLEVFGGAAFGRDSNSLSNLVGPIFQRQELDSPYVLGALGAVLPVTEKLGVGFGFYTPLLQGFNFQDTSNQTGTTLSDKGSAVILAWNTSASYQVTPTFSVGLGANLLYGKLSNDTTLTNPPPPFLAGDTLVGHSSGDGVAPEGIVGFRYDPDPKVSLGFVYRTGANVRLRGDATATSKFLPMESSAFTFVLKQPATSGIGVAYRPNSNWTLTSDLDWTFWRSFSNAVTYDNPQPLLANQQDTYQWRNTWKIRFGALYRLTEKTDLLGGYSFGDSAVDAASIDLSTTIDVPIHKFSGGLTHRWRDWLESSFGIMAGYGTRTEGAVNYRLAGIQGMYETRFRF